jgi:aldose 1-epimerase
MDCGLYLLTPWSNRIAGARLSFGGRHIELEPSFPDGSAIHGEGWRSAWRMTDRSPISATCVLHTVPEPGRWPWAMVHTVRYVIEETPRAGGMEVGLRVELSVTNVDDTPCPAGLGFHPFLASTFHGRRGVVTFPGLARYPAVGQIPVGPAQRDEMTAAFERGVDIGTLEADDVFVAPRWGEARVTYGPREVSFEVGPEVTHAVVYAPAHGRFICLEPVTMANDAFNAPDAQARGVVALGPGQTLRTSCVMRVHGVA